MNEGPESRSDSAPTATDSGTSKPDSKAQERGFLRKAVDLLVETEKVAARIAGAITSVGVIVGAIVLLSHGSAPPGALEASFLGTTVQEGVLLEQYEDENKPLNAVYEPAGGASATGSREEAGLITITPTATAPTSTSPPTTDGFSSPEAEREEANTLTREAKLKQVHAQIEVEKQKEETHQREAHAGEEHQNEPTHPERRTTGRERERLQNAGQLREQAKTEAEDGKLKASEAEKLKREEEHPGSAPVVTAPVAPLHQEGDAEVAVGTSPSRQTVEAVVKQSGVPLPSTCGESCAISPVIDKALSEYAANTDEAARQVASIFHDSRQGIFGHKRQPLGVAVHFSVDLVGYAGRLLLIDWSLCSASTGRPLPREWLRNVPVEQVRPTSNRLKHPGNFWAPLPPKRGHYFFRLRVFNGSSEVVQTQTHVFR